MKRETKRRKRMVRELEGLLAQLRDPESPAWSLRVDYANGWGDVASTVDGVFSALLLGEDVGDDTYNVIVSEELFGKLVVLGRKHAYGRRAPESFRHPFSDEALAKCALDRLASFAEGGGETLAAWLRAQRPQPARPFHETLPTWDGLADTPAHHEVQITSESECVFHEFIEDFLRDEPRWCTDMVVALLCEREEFVAECRP